jgi:hypothetical protein
MANNNKNDVNIHTVTHTLTPAITLGIMASGYMYLIINKIEPPKEMVTTMTTLIGYFVGQKTAK